MRRRLDISASIVVTPELMFLDEPTTGLDPRSRNQVWDIVRALVAGGTTILLCTQYLEEADQLAEGIAVIDHGKVIAEGTPAQLKASVGSGALKVRLLDPAQRAEAERVLASALDGEVDAQGGDASLLTAPCADADRAAAAVSALTAAGVGVADFSLGQPSLDEVFLALTGRPADEPGPELEEAGGVSAVDATAAPGVDEARVRKAIASAERPAPTGARGRHPRLRLAGDAQGAPRARAAAGRDGHADHVHADVHLPLRRRDRGLHRRRTATTSCPASWCRRSCSPRSTRAWC